MDLRVLDKFIGGRLERTRARFCPSAFRRALCDWSFADVLSPSGRYNRCCNWSARVPPPNLAYMPACVGPCICAFATFRYLRLRKMQASTILAFQSIRSSDRVHTHLETVICQTSGRLNAWRTVRHSTPSSERRLRPPAPCPSSTVRRVRAQRLGASRPSTDTVPPPWC